MRIAIPGATSAQLLYVHDRTCCVCNQPGLPVQIHHIDENPSNNDADNLAVLCLHDHEQTQIRGGFGKKLKAEDVRLCRTEWLARVAKRREEADNLVIARLSRGPEIQVDDDTWRRPSMEALATTIQTLPLIYEDISKRADPFLSSVVRRDMIHGASMIVDVFAESWVRLSAWLPPLHFGSMTSQEYITAFIADCNRKNMSLHEPDGPGSGGREAAICALGDTMQDMEGLIHSLIGKYAPLLDDFSFEDWKIRWKAVDEKRMAETETPS